MICIGDQVEPQFSLCLCEVRGRQNSRLVQNAYELFCLDLLNFNIYPRTNKLFCVELGI